MFYYEEKTVLGRWTPRTSPDRPDGKSVEGTKRAMRNVQEVPPAMQAFDLDSLRAFFNPEEVL